MGKKEKISTCVYIYELLDISFSFCLPDFQHIFNFIGNLVDGITSKSLKTISKIMENRTKKRVSK